MTDEQTPSPRYEWERIVRRIVMPGNEKLLALVLATYADRDGSRVRPGNQVLAAVTGMSERTVKRALAALRDCGLLAVSRRGGGRDGQGRATEYQLTIPGDLLDRVSLLDPSEATVSGATQVASQNDPSPVDNSNERGVDNRPAADVSEATQVAHENDFQGPNSSIEGPPGWPTTNTHPPATKRRPSLVATQGDSSRRVRLVENSERRAV